MKSLSLLYAFLGGAIVGCATALLTTPMKGDDLREKIVKALRRKGVKINNDEVDALVAELSSAIEK